MPAHYQLNCGQFVLHDGAKPISAPMDEIAVAFTRHADDDIIVLHKHGSAHGVSLWCEATKAKLRKSDPQSELAAGIRLVTLRSPIPPGSFPIEMLNLALAGNQAARKTLFLPELTIDAAATVIPSNSAE